MFKKIAQQDWSLSRWQLWSQKGLQYTDPEQANNNLARLFPKKITASPLVTVSA